MTFTELYQKYLAVLWSAFQYDMNVFSKPWLYAWLVPATFYLAFFIVKWIFLTFPVWGPFALVLKFLSVTLNLAVITLRLNSLRSEIKRRQNKETNEKEGDQTC